MHFSFIPALRHISTLSKLNDDGFRNNLDTVISLMTMSRMLIQLKTRYRQF